MCAYACMRVILCKKKERKNEKKKIKDRKKDCVLSDVVSLLMENEIITMPLIFMYLCHSWGKVSD